MDKPSVSKRKGRRMFLKTMALLGGSAAVLAAKRGLAGNPPVKNNAAGESAARSQGYRLTPHIKRYYERARF